MQEQFVDRILTCVDCQGEFIFTAGEQLFFFDKQFKNDPKRCKPCKSRRSGLAAAANGATGPAAAGLSRTETRTQCSDCGIETTVPFKPTQGRPVLCRQCFQLKNRAAAGVPVSVPSPMPVSTPGFMQEAALSLASASEEDTGVRLSPDAALVAASSLVAAPPQSSVATPADLAYVAGLNGAAAAKADAPVSAELLAMLPPELHVPVAPTQELQPALAEAPQA